LKCNYRLSGSLVRKVFLLSIIILEPSLLIDNDKNLDDAAAENNIEILPHDYVLSYMTYKNEE